MAISPLINTGNVLTFDILVDGTIISDEVLVSSISTSAEINKEASADIVIQVDAEKINQASNNFPEGKEIEIKSGYDGSNHSIFKGTIANQNLEFKGNSGINITVSCKADKVAYRIGPKADLILTFGRDVFSASIELDTSHSPSVNQGKTLPHIPKTKPKSTKGEISFPGSSLAKVSSLVELAGFGKTYNGNALINKVEHVLAEGKWITSIGLGMVKQQLQPNETPTADAEPVSGDFHNFEGYKISVNKEDKTLTIETPQANQLVFSDKEKSVLIQDQNGNQLTMNESGIQVKSNSNLLLEANGEIKLKAGSNIIHNAATNINLEAGAKTEIKSTTNVNIEGMDIELNAQVRLEATGGASAELSAGGSTTVKGAMVMIN